MAKAEDLEIKVKVRRDYALMIAVFVIVACNTVQFIIAQKDLDRKATQFTENQLTIAAGIGQVQEKLSYLINKECVADLKRLDKKADELAEKNAENKKELGKIKELYGVSLERYKNVFANSMGLPTELPVKTFGFVDPPLNDKAVK